MSDQGGVPLPAEDLAKHRIMNTSKIDKYNLKHYTRLIISFFGCLVLLTCYQYTTLYIKGVLDTILSTSLLIAIVHQLGYAAIIGILFVFAFNFWENLRPKYGFNLVFGALLFLLIIEALLITYYCTTLVPLGSDLLGYSYEDMKTTVSNSGGLSLTTLLGILGISGLFFIFYKVTSRFYHRISRLYPFTIILTSLFVATLFTEGRPINQNKTQYLAVNLYNSTTENNTYDSNVEYPLIKRPEGKNSLGEYFELKEEKPNIVFIIVEGLGRDFVGEGAEFGGFTPFLDSLSGKSLYWENFLSNTGRTFGVVPSLLGSLPFGKSGFMELEEYPNKLTLYGILKNNGYYTSYNQGTNSTFDNVEKFLRSENIDFVLDRSGFGKNYELQEADAAGSSWGYPDKELFKKALSLPRDADQPRLDVYMTISTHEPFIPPRKEYYENKVAELVTTGNYESRVKNIIKKNDNVFASLLYTDNAIAWFLEAYKKQPGYDNTIFIITGDHRLIPIPQRNTISRFHVPLIVYSPMLKATEKISSVSSHFDVTPSILAMLQHAFELKMPKKVAWMGSGLDMQKEFRSVKDIPLMRNKNELKEFISGEQVYTDGDIMGIDKNMDLSPSFGGSSKLEKKLTDFKAMNAYVTTRNKIIPDSLSLFTLEREKFGEGEMVWINSVYNGKNSDKAYVTARDLAFKKEYTKSLLLCRYILSEVPGHIDSKILTGRINAWEGNYDTAVTILKECIKMVPEYVDSYAALFDVYFWSGKTKEGYELIEHVEQNSSSAGEVADKIARAKKEYGKIQPAVSSIDKTETTPEAEGTTLN